MKSNYKAMVLSCIDPRFQPIVYKYLKKKKLVGQYSAFTIAGSSIGVTAKSLKDGIKFSGIILILQLNYIILRN